MIDTESGFLWHAYRFGGFFYSFFYMADARVVLDEAGRIVLLHVIIIKNCDTVESGHFYFPLTTHFPTF